MNKEIAEGIAEYLYEMMQDGDFTQEAVVNFLINRKVDLDILNALEVITGSRLI